MSRPPPPEPESLPAGRIAAALLVTMAIVVLSAAGGRLLERQTRTERRPPPAAIGKSEIGRQFQRPFALEQTASQSRLAQHQRLESYGWVDRRRELIHVPIERAFEAVLSAEGER